MSKWTGPPFCQGLRPEYMPAVLQKNIVPKEGDRIKDQILAKQK
jgi:hypothetical protein